MADSSYLGFVFLISGVAIFLIIKFISDVSYGNRAIFIWQANSLNKKAHIKIGVADLIKVVKLREIKNRAVFITKDLPIGIGELKNEFGREDLVGIDDEIRYILKKPDSDMWMKNDMIHSGDIYMAICSKKLYEHALHTGSYLIAKTVSDLLAKNGFVSPESIDLNRLKSHGLINTMLLTKTQELKLHKKMLSYYTGNGLLLLISCENYLRLITA